jgi:hypothetical protein
MNLWIVLSQAAADPWGVSSMGQGRTEIVTQRECDVEGVEMRAGRHGRASLNHSDGPVCSPFRPLPLDYLVVDFGLQAFGFGQSFFTPASTHDSENVIAIDDVTLSAPECRPLEPYRTQIAMRVVFGARATRSSRRINSSARPYTSSSRRQAPRLSSRVAPACPRDCA